MDSISSCHKLSFPHVARLAGYALHSYRDEPFGRMEAIAPRWQALARLTLRVRIAGDGAVPNAAILDRLHRAAHRSCFIANSVKIEGSVDASAQLEGFASEHR